jgi:hypothetical protein
MEYPVERVVRFTPATETESVACTNSVAASSDTLPETSTSVPDVSFSTVVVPPPCGPGELLVDELF